jgi:hypothetical protein
MQWHFSFPIFGVWVCTVLQKQRYPPQGIQVQRKLRDGMQSRCAIRGGYIHRGATFK